MGFVEEMKWRGLVSEYTGLEDLKSRTVSGYIGFDPTASESARGPLMQIMNLARLQRAAPPYRWSAVEWSIGDPSGKAGERPLLTTAQAEENASDTPATARLSRFRLRFQPRHPSTTAIG